MKRAPKYVSRALVVTTTTDALPKILAEIKGMAAVEEDGALYAADYLAWGRRKLVELYHEVEAERAKDAEEQSERPVYRTDVDDRIKIVKAINQNLQATATVASEIRMRRKLDFRADPEFQDLWRVLASFVRNHPAFAADLERRMQEIGIHDRLR
jgi:hypothetical protein